MNAKNSTQTPTDLHLTCKHHPVPVPMVCLDIQPSPRGGTMAIYGCAHRACPYRQGWAFDTRGRVRPVWFGIVGDQRTTPTTPYPYHPSVNTMPRIPDLTTLFRQQQTTTRDPDPDPAPFKPDTLPVPQPAPRSEALVSLVGYHHAGLVLVEPTRPFDPEFPDVLDQLELGLGSAPNLTEGLRTALAVHHTLPIHPQASRVIWLISSGQPEPRDQHLLRVADACRRAGIILNTVAMGYPDDPRTLAELAETTQRGRAFWVEDSRALARTLASTPPRHPGASVIALDCSDAMLMPMGNDTRMGLAIDGLRRYLQHLTRQYL